MAQATSPAHVLWVSPYTHEDDASESGTYYDWQWTPNWEHQGQFYDRWVPIPRDPQPAPGSAQLRRDSGEDWWYGHCNAMENGQFTGFYTVGYSSWPNCYWKGYGCSRTFEAILTSPQASGSTFAPRPKELELPNHRKGDTRGVVARLDADGHDIWYRPLLTNETWNVIPTSDGNIVVCGFSDICRWPAEDLLPGDNPVIRFNDFPGVDMNTVDCAVFQTPVRHFGYLTKLSPDGHLLWTSMAVPGDALPAAYDLASLFQDVSEVQGPNGPEYWAVGTGTSAAQAWPPRPYIARFAADGTYLGGRQYLAGQSGLPANWPLMPDRGQFTSIAADPATGLVIATGWYLINDSRHAFIAAFNAAAGDLQPLWMHHTGDPSGPLAASGGHDPLLPHSTSGGGFVLAGATRIVWPVQANFSLGIGYSGPNAATLLVHGLDLNGNLLWTSNLGGVRAYDLQSDVTSTADGRIALVCTVAGSPAGPPHFSSLPPETQDCLLTTYGYDPEGPAPAPDWPSAGEYAYWDTDAYAAKLDPSNGNLIWAATWDADPDYAFACAPPPPDEDRRDIRNQECMYKITETPDGGLVVSGNSSHNFDDYYLAKVMPPCQARHSFAPLPLDAEGRHILAANTTWSTDMDIYGTIVIPAGIALTIANCTIRFADTEQLAWPTRIVVERGGALLLEDATLTSIDACPNSLWDGIELRGNYFAQQTLPNQGYLNVKNSTIANARAAVLAARGDFNNPLGAIVKESTGGIVHARDARFLNNVYDAVFRPFENRLPNGAVIPNASSFARCEFVTDGGVPAEGHFPKDHVALLGVRGIPFRGCDWRNTLLGQQPELPNQLGTGIHAVNSSFTVADDCASLVPLGTPCPPQDLTTSTFTNLHRGILATTFKADRTFSVDNATFTGTHFGIRMEGIQDASITRCQFNVPTPLVPGIVGPTYGVYSDQCTGYRIQENAFVATSPSTHSSRKVGLIIKDSGPYHNTFYNNTFDNLLVGSIIEGDNASPDEALGLEVKCNDYGLSQPNSFDVALTGSTVRVQKTQGEPLNPIDPSTYGNPAGNRFSLDHAANPASYDAEADWHVQQIATVVEYFHHTPTPGNRTKPEYSSSPAELIASDQNVFWPNKTVACPSQLNDGGKEEKRLIAEGEHEEYESSKEAYDATKDNGDTYTLLGYVSDPAKSSAQVRNALQSVSPKVSAEVWRAAFERNPPMTAWHITQALLSNSPLQHEVLLMVHDYGLPAGYATMVQAAQGGVNVLTQLEAAIARHGGNKAEALADLGRMSWLDSLNLGGALDSLRLFHESLPAENNTLALSGVLDAKGDYSALLALALAEESGSDAPERYTLLKQYAQLQQQAGWAEPDAALLTWLSNLGQQRDVLGSAWANAWLHALGVALPEEVIILPEEGPKSTGRDRHVQAVQWPDEDMLEVFPNPARNVAYVAFDLSTSENAQLRLLDLHGRQLSSQALSSTEGIATIPLEGLSSGLYMLELVRTDAPSQQVRLVVQ